MISPYILNKSPELLRKVKSTNNNSASQDSDNFVNYLSASPSEQDIKRSLRKIGELQKLILVQVYSELEDKEQDRVRLSLSKWLGGDSISNSNRATWSKALRKLVEERKLIIKTFTDRNSLSKVNTGNSIVYVSLTDLGYAAAKWLIKNDLF